MAEISAILERAKFLRESKWRPPEFVEWAPEIVAFLEKNLWAPFIGALLDQQIKAEHAWAFPKWLNEKFGRLDGDLILELKRERQLKKILEEYMESKWPSRMREKERKRWIERMNNWLPQAIMFLKSNNRNPITMFENRKYAVQELYFLLRQIPGFGPKKTKMIVRDFVYSDIGFSKHKFCWYEQVKKELPNFGIEKGSIGKLDVPIDVLVKIVFKRFVFGQDYVPKRDDYSIAEDIIMFAKLAFPEFPARLDELFWYVGHVWCKAKPACEECRLRDRCAYRESRKS